MGEIMKHPDELYPLMKLMLSAKHVEKKTPVWLLQPHWAFCYATPRKVSRRFALVIQQLPSDLRDVVYLVLRALDIVGGTMAFKVLMDQFHHVSIGFLELGKNYQEVIKDITKRMGEGMAKFLCKEVIRRMYWPLTCLSRSLKKLCMLATDTSIVGYIFQKISIIRDYLEDINEVPKCRMFWPRQIWSKYVNKLEDFKYEENSVKAVQCLNEMVINMGNLTMYYNNVEIFKGVVEMRRGLCTKIIDQMRTMADVYGAFFDFCCIMESKVDRDDTNATSTLKRLEEILKTCRDSGTLINQRKSYTFSHQPNYNTPVLIQHFELCCLNSSNIVAPESKPPKMHYF
ncbi:hypothetical protein H5410_054197 [Solanum commersonii]|uniref:Uncharacterized protein n=1 Tax=Solanum commersonii TaxID=4109 RepID=A0A9J5X6S9_SOLCO|nr:hypothetical protein H5410_054197 [Solanum commersonii]